MLKVTESCRNFEREYIIKFIFSNITITVLVGTIRIKTEAKILKMMIAYIKVVVEVYRKILALW